MSSPWTVLLLPVMVRPLTPVPAPTPFNWMSGGPA